MKVSFFIMSEFATFEEHSLGHAAFRDGQHEISIPGNIMFLVETGSRGTHRQPGGLLLFSTVS